MKHRIAGLVALALLGFGLVNAANPLAPSDADSAPPTPIELARRTGKPVEIPELGSETTRVTANPAGDFTAETYMQPAFAKRGNAWVPINTNLVSNADGSVSPAAAAPMTFSGGGTAPLVQLRDKGGNSLSLRWTGELPKPRLEGSAAIYPDLLPGVDLHLRATATGFTETLVVKDAKAAASLKQVKFKLETKGLKVRPDGSISDGGGTTVFTSPPAFMWDSSGGVARINRAKEPQPGDKIERVGTKWTADALTVVPDRKMLTNPKTVFPVYVDPPVAGVRVHWTMITEEYPSYGWWDTIWRGRVGAVSDGTQNTPKYYRSYFQQDVSALKNTYIKDATLFLHSIWSSSCTKRPIQVWESGPISPLTTWMTQPTLVRKVAEVTEAKGFSSPQCDAGDIAFPVTDLVQQAANAGKSDITLAVRTPEVDPFTVGGTEIFNGADTDSGPKGPRLSVTYNTMPGAPSLMATGEENKLCKGTGEILDGGSVTTQRPTLYARLDDADGAVQGQKVAANFQWRFPNGSGENGTTTGFESPGKTFSFATETLSVGKHQWRVRAVDGDDQAHGGFGPWSPWCEFNVDTTPPANPPTGSVDPPSAPQFGTVTLTLTAQDPDVVKFKYTVPGQGEQEVAADHPGGSASVPVYATQDGNLQAIEVRAIDAADLSGPAGYVDFFVEGLGVSTGEWKLDGPEEGRAPDSRGSAPANISGAVSWEADGRDGGSMQFNGGYLSTDSTVLQTDSSYTVMAWVRLDDFDNWHTIVSQDGDYDSGFFLQYSGWTRTWEFGMGSEDTNGNSATNTFLPSSAIAQRGVWTHVAGVNDRDNNELRLYVNGRLTNRMTSTIARTATGPLVIGRGQKDGQATWPFKGRIDEVRAYQRAMTDNEIKYVAQPDANGPEGHWSFEDTPGFVAADSSAEHNDLAVRFRNPGTSWVPGKIGKALHFDGATAQTSDFLHTPQSVVDTSKSFTIAAWVRPNSLADYPYAICQESGNQCGFALGYHSYPTPAWSFAMATTDLANTEQEPNRSQWHQALANGAAWHSQVNEWTHLAGVYDAQAHELRLYVNGKLAGRTPHTSNWVAKGAVVVGRGMSNAYWTNWWKGDIDEVNLVQSVMTEAELGELVKPAKFGPTAEFHLDPGASLSDDSTENDHRLQLYGEVASTTDGVTGGGALKFTGVGDAATAGPVADTSTSFTVAAWVKLADATKSRIAVSQDGDRNSGFSIGYRKDENRFHFEMLKSDTDGPWWSTLLSVSPPVVNEWAYLIGVYDATRGEMRLYVNGQLQGTIAHNSTWRAMGTLILGRGKNSGWLTDLWVGGIDEVKILDKAAKSTDVAGLANLPAPPVDGPIRFENTYSHQCLSDASAEATNGYVFQKDCREMVTGYALESYFDGSYRIYAAHPKYGTGCLGVDGGATGNNFKVQDGICQDGLGQRVRFEPVSQPVVGYRIRFVHSNRCIGIYAKSGEQDIAAIQTDCSASDPTQIWKLDDPRADWPENGPPQESPQTGRLAINPAHSNMCLGEKTTASGITNWWRMNNPLASTTLDMAGTKPGANTNVTWSLDAQRGVVGAFNGTSSVAKWTTSPVDTTKSMTLGVWVRLADKAQDRYVWTVSGNLGESPIKLSYRKATDKWVVEGATRASGATTNTWWNASTAAGVPQAGVWQHLAVVIDATGKTAKIYVNGTSRATASVPTGFNNGATSMNIGDQYGSLWFNGHLSDVQTYVRALTDADVTGIYSSTNGNVYQGPCDGITPEYSIYRTSKSSDTWTIKVKHPLFGAGCMGVYGSSVTSGERIRDVQCNSGDATAFKLEAVSIPVPGYRIKSSYSNMCLTVKDGQLTGWAQVVQQACDPTLKHQVFKLQALDPVVAPPTGVRRVRSVQSGLCMSEKPASGGDTKVYQTYCTNANPALTVQLLNSTSDSGYVIKASDASNGTACMGVPGSSESDQTQLADLYPCGLGKNQRFSIDYVREPVAGYRIHTMHTTENDMCVAVAGQSMANWATIVQEVCDETKKSQIWLFDDPTAPTPTPTPTPGATAAPTPAPSATYTSPVVRPTVSAYGSCESTDHSGGWGVAISGSVSYNLESVSSASASWNAAGVDANYGPPSGSTSLSVSGSSFSGNIPPQSGWEFVGGTGVSWTVTVTLANGQSYSNSGYTSNCNTP